MPSRSSPVWLPLWYALALLSGAVLLFAASGLAFGFSSAWELLTGLSSPSGMTWPVLAWGLSATGYILVPALIGISVAVGSEILVESKLSPLEDRINELEETLIPPRLVAPTDTSSDTAGSRDHE